MLSRSPRSARCCRLAWAAVAPMAYSIRQFCQAHSISVDTYFRLQRAGLGPVTMKVGGRTLISVEAAAAWRRDRELASQEARQQRKTNIAGERRHLTRERRPGKRAAPLLIRPGERSAIISRRS